MREILLSSWARQRRIFNGPAIEKAIIGEREFGRVVWGLMCIERWYSFIGGDFKPRYA